VHSTRSGGIPKLAARRLCLATPKSARTSPAESAATSPSLNLRELDGVLPSRRYAAKRGRVTALQDAARLPASICYLPSSCLHGFPFLFRLRQLPPRLDAGGRLRLNLRCVGRGRLHQHNAAVRPVLGDARGRGQRAVGRRGVASNPVRPCAVTRAAASNAASRLVQAVKPGSRGRIDDEGLGGAVVLDRVGHVAPVHRGDAVGILLQVPSRRRRGPGNVDG
jgi:hypothetical protein